MVDQNTAQFGVVGLGVMGSALAENIEDHGLSVAVWNHTPSMLTQFMLRLPGRRFLPSLSLQEFVRAVERPRRILLMIKAGDPVDSMIDQLLPLLQQGDILIDGGNSWFKDTQRRETRLRDRGLDFVGMGVSGGEKGARFGPSMMPGGPARAWEALRPVLEPIAASTDSGPCVTHVGPDGAGHFVKMVHNGIEYGDMQLIAEAYDLLRKAARMSADEIASVFHLWSHGPLDSFLIALTATVLRKPDPETGRPLVDMIADAAGQKGTGRWTAESAMELGVPAPTLTAALEAREISAMRAERIAASTQLPGPSAPALDGAQRQQLVDDLQHAVFASRICAYAQGMNAIRSASAQYGWDVKLRELARIWKGGCIIRARLLDTIMAAYDRDPALPNLLLAPALKVQQDGWRRVVSLAAAYGVPCPALGASLSYFDSYRSATLPQNLIQAQRDAFGAHTYERTDKPGFVHSDWE